MREPQKPRGKRVWVQGQTSLHSETLEKQNQTTNPHTQTKIVLRNLLNLQMGRDMRVDGGVCKDWTMETPVTLLAEQGGCHCGLRLCEAPTEPAHSRHPSWDSLCTHLLPSHGTWISWLCCLPELLLCSWPTLSKPVIPQLPFLDPQQMAFAFTLSESETDLSEIFC